MRDTTKQTLAPVVNWQNLTAAQVDAIERVEHLHDGFNAGVRVPYHVLLMALYTTGYDSRPRLDDAPEPVVKRKGGRPPGSKNKPKEVTNGGS